MAGDEQIDRRFEQLIKAEYGDVPGSGFHGPRQAPLTERRTIFGRRKELRDPIEYFNLEQAIDDVDDAEIEGWTPPPAPPIGKFSRAVKWGATLVGIAVIVGFLLLAGTHLPAWVRVSVVVAFCIGMAMLLRAIPDQWNHRGDLPDEDY